jgi:hypothetical protein
MLGYSVTKQAWRAGRVVCAVVEDTAQRTEKSEKEENSLKRLAYLLTAALVAMLVFLPSAFAQGTLEQTVMYESTQPLPASGGMLISDPALLLPAVALLLGTGVLGYAVMRRR